MCVDCLSGFIFVQWLEIIVTTQFTDDDLLAWLDEQLPVERMSALEQALRDSEELRQRVSIVRRRRDSGAHSVGEIWRRNRLSCPDRETLGSWLLGVLDEEIEQYIEFHVNTVGCRLCQTMVSEFETAQTQQDAEPRAERTRRFFESSAGLLPDDSAPNAEF
jgi:anti-sigma factor RsiW